MQCRHSSSSLAVVLFFAFASYAQEPANPGGAAPIQATQAQPTASAAPFGEITGTVKSGNIPLPGVTISASNTLTGKKYITSSDVDGSFKIQLGSKGRYVVRAELSAFAPVTQEILINAENRNGKANLSMMLLSRAQSETQQQQTQQIAGGATGRGMQSLSLAGSDLTAMAAAAAAGNGESGSQNAISELPNASLAAEGNTESVAVSGATGRSEQPTFDFGEMQDKIAELRDQLARQGGGSGSVDLGGGRVGYINILGGGMMGGGGGIPMGGAMPMGGGPITIALGGGPGGGGRGFRNFNVNRPHGSLFYSLGDSVLDAKPYSLTGQETAKPSYQQSQFGASIGGPLNIPHIYHGGTKTFLFGNYTGRRSKSPYDVFSTVPTLAERSGDFSQTLSFSGAGAGNPVQIFDPLTHTQFANNLIPSFRINSAAAALLKFFPTANLPGTRQNFHYVASAPSDTDIASVRFNHTFGPAPSSMFGGIFGESGGARREQRQQQRDKRRSSPTWRQSINGGFNYANIRLIQLNPFPTLGGKQTVHNSNVNAGYNLSKNRFFNSLRFNYNYAQNDGRNQFTNTNNIAAALGITGISQLPTDYGLPNLSFTNYSGLRDFNPQFRTNQTYSISESMNWSRGKHSFSWGGDYRRLRLDLSRASNARGTFVFTGFETASNPTAQGSGYDLADFLLGLPQQTSIQFGASNYQFRANSWDLFAQDNWKLANNVTLNLGLRYEYTSPYAEAHNRLTNLDAAPGFTAVAPVQPGQSGPFSGKFPAGLINPDRKNFAPRVGIAWKPFSKTVVRTGYGINYNVGQYGSMVTQLAFQPPFAFTETNTNCFLADGVCAVNPNVPSGAQLLTLQNGFPAATSSLTNNFGVDRNYRLAYVQSWNLDIQQELPQSMVLNVGYTGAKGTRLDIVRAPNRCIGRDCSPSGTLIPGVQPFNWESSEGASVLDSGSIRLRKRMRQGFSVGGSYTFSKSIDNASSIGGGGTVVAQNDKDLAAERSLSSFDQRHRFGGDYIYQLPFGANKKWLKGTGWQERVFGGFQWSGSFTIASGNPFTPRVLGNFGDVSRGTNGTLRSDYNGQPIQISDPGVARWFNTAAFTQPHGTFGNARRNLIMGPGTVQFDMTFSKNIAVTETQGLNLSISASNVFNHEHFTSIDTAVNSPTYGQVVERGSMRKIQISTRYSF